MLTFTCKQSIDRRNAVSEESCNLANGDRYEHQTLREEFRGAAVMGGSGGGHFIGYTLRTHTGRSGTLRGYLSKSGIVP
jgi:hypothetical protein